MQEWSDRIAHSLKQPTLKSEETEELLLLAREVSHGTGQRAVTPLATFLVGLAVAETGGTRSAAIRKAHESLRSLIGQEGERG